MTTNESSAVLINGDGTNHTLKNTNRIITVNKSMVQQTKHLPTFSLTCSTHEPKRKRVNGKCVLNLVVQFLAD